MTLRWTHIIYLSLVALLYCSCASYNKQASIYYTNLREGNYEKAGKALDNNKLLGKGRNRLLYLLERGKIFHLLQQYDSSNKYFNEADLLMENGRVSVKDIAFGTLINPMMETYRGEDFEKYLIHYYKSLNYLQLGLPEEALVEARRISLRAYTQEEKTGNGDRYSDDAFSYMLQGMIYEKNGDINNAFIAYRNAADVYLKYNGSYYGTTMPEQLKKDVLRTAWQNGFAEELSRYEKLFNTSFVQEERAEGGELVIFWENGSAPVKQQHDIYFSLYKGAGGGFFFEGGGFNNIPFDFSSGYDSDKIKLEDFDNIKISLPRYMAQPLHYSTASLQLNNRTYMLEPAENVNTLAFTTLQERMVKELSATLTRLAIKKLAEIAVRPKEKVVDKEKSKEEQEKEEKKRNRREAIALGIQLFSFFSEKADTRNWQSLPHTIYYTRIPLKQGMNEIRLEVKGSSSKTIQLNVQGNGRLQFRNICTLK